MATTKWRIIANRLDPNQRIWKPDTITLVTDGSTPHGSSVAVPVVGSDGTINQTLLPENLRQGLRFRGEFAIGEHYLLNDVVTYDNSAYVANIEIVSAVTTPDADPNFDILAAGGTGPVVVTAEDVTTSNPEYPTVAAALDTLLYEPPQILSFTSSTQIAEVGESVASVTLNWQYNKAMKSHSLTGLGNMPDLTKTSAIFAGPFTYDQNWTLTAIDDKDSSVSASASLSFQRKRYWGVSANTSLSNDEIIAFSSEFATNDQKSMTYDCTGGVYPYFCYPASWGTLMKVTVNGFSFTAYTVASQSVVNAHGHRDTYYIVRFNYKQNSNNLKVSWQ